MKLRNLSNDYEYLVENRILLLVYFSVLDPILYKKFPTSYDSIVCNTSMMRSVRTIEHLGNDFELMDFIKYLNCPICKKIEFYCMEHRIEMEMILAGRNSRVVTGSQKKVTVMYRT